MDHGDLLVQRFHHVRFQEMLVGGKQSDLHSPISLVSVHSTRPAI
jgi:hypothetical protein